MNTIILNWADFKALATSKNFRIQYTETGSIYYIFAVDGILQYETEIFKNATNQVANATLENENQDDFETNYKANANLPLEYKSSDGLTKFAPSKFADVLSLYVDGTNGLADMGAGETKYCKTHYSFSYTLAGVNVTWSGSNWGDYVDFEAGFYTDEADESTFYSINKFGDHYRIYESGKITFDVPTVKVIPSTVQVAPGVYKNIYIRSKCVNTGSNASKVMINLVGWK